MSDAPRIPRPSSEVIDFRSPEESDLPHLIALQTDAALMRYYGGVQERANIERRHERAMEHDRKFGFGLWSLYERSTGAFSGIGGVIRYNFDFASEKFEIVVCLTHEAQRRGLSRHLFGVLHTWCREAGILDRTVIRVEPGHSQVKFLQSYEGHRLFPVVRMPSALDDRYVFFQLASPPEMGIPPAGPSTP